MGLSLQESGTWLLALWERALSKVQGDVLVEHSLKQFPERWQAGAGGRCIALALGKAATAMAIGASRVLGSQLDEGLLITKTDHGSALPGWTTWEASHPVPDEASVRAGQLVMELAQNLGPHDRFLFLLSGGASSLCVAPVPGLGLEEKARLGKALLHVGASIHEMNCVRKHLSLCKGGGLRRLVSPAYGWTLALSDVPGDAPDAIGSGPTVPDPTTFADALSVLQAYHLTSSFPNIVHLLEQGVQGSLPETLKHDEECEGLMDYDCLLSNSHLQTVLKQEAESVYPNCEALGPLEVEVEDLAVRVIERIKQSLNSEHPVMWVGGGEPTLVVQGEGLGGRMQHLGMLVSEGLAGQPGWFMLAVGSDGTDGPTDAAGALVDGRTWNQVKVSGEDVMGLKASYDSYHYHHLGGSLVKTGPTGTHVGDIVLIVVQPVGAFS